MQLSCGSAISAALAGSDLRAVSGKKIISQKKTDIIVLQNPWLQTLNDLVLYITLVFCIILVVMEEGGDVQGWTV